MSSKVADYSSNADLYSIFDNYTFDQLTIIAQGILVESFIKNTKHFPSMHLMIYLGLILLPPEKG